MERTLDAAVREGAVTISALADGRKASVPFIRLRGKWLEKLGWLVGDHVQVRAGRDVIMLLKEVPATAGECQTAMVSDGKDAGRTYPQRQAAHIVVSAHGGLIEGIQSFMDKGAAIEKAIVLWKKADPEADDIKVFSQDGVCQWAPPKA